MERQSVYQPYGPRVIDTVMLLLAGMPALLRRWTLRWAVVLGLLAVAVHSAGRLTAGQDVRVTGPGWWEALPVTVLLSGWLLGARFSRGPALMSPAAGAPTAEAPAAPAPVAAA